MSAIYLGFLLGVCVCIVVMVLLNPMPNIGQYVDWYRKGWDDCKNGKDRI